MNKPDTYQMSIFAGIVLLLIGVQLRLVDSYVLTSGATNALARITGPPAESPHGAFRQIVVDTAAPKKRIRPWPWLGWACISLGTVLASYGVMHKWKRK